MVHLAGWDLPEILVCPDRFVQARDRAAASKVPDTAAAVMVNSRSEGAIGLQLFAGTQPRVLRYWSIEGLGDDGD
jgi:hypothetical protein